MNNKRIKGISKPHQFLLSFSDFSVVFFHDLLQTLLFFFMLFLKARKGRRRQWACIHTIRVFAWSETIGCYKIQLSIILIKLIYTWKKLSVQWLIYLSLLLLLPSLSFSPHFSLHCSLSSLSPSLPLPLKLLYTNTIIIHWRKEQRNELWIARHNSTINIQQAAGTIVGSFDGETQQCTGPVLA